MALAREHQLNVSLSGQHKNGVKEMKMKFNWKVILILVVLIGTVIWGVETLRPRFYGGTNVEFGIGNGSVQVTNLSNMAVPIELVGAGTGSFTISSPSSDIAGSSVREGTGRTSTQSLIFALPSGDSEFTVAGGKDVSLISNSGIPLEAKVNPFTLDQFTDRFVLMMSVIFGSLFALSSINDHRWISASRRQKARDQAAAQKESQETFKRMFGR